MFLRFRVSGGQPLSSYSFMAGIQRNLLSLNLVSRISKPINFRSYSDKAPDQWASVNISLTPLGPFQLEKYFLRLIIIFTQKFIPIFKCQKCKCCNKFVSVSCETISSSLLDHATARDKVSRSSLRCFPKISEVPDCYSDID